MAFKELLEKSVGNRIFFMITNFSDVKVLVRNHIKYDLCHTIKFYNENISF